MKNLLKQELIKNAVAKLDEPWKNLTAKDVAKDLKMGENLANELYKNNSLGLVQAKHTENFQNETEEIYIDEEEDEMEF